MRGLGLVVVFLLSIGSLNAAIDAYPFPNEKLQGRYNELIDELRCPQCLNTNLAGSDAMIARDLRREVHRLLLEGKTDAEILEFMYQRYGDFILYRPRLSVKTGVLWLTPIALLLLAVTILFRMTSRDDPESTLTATEQQKLDRLLKNDEQQV